MRSEPTTQCALCRRSVLTGEPLVAWHDARAERPHAVCELCSSRAEARGWHSDGERVPARASGRIRVEPLLQDEADALHEATGSRAAIVVQQAVLDRIVPHEPDSPPAAVASPALLARVREQERELVQLREQSSPAAIAAQHDQLKHRELRIHELEAQLRARDERIALLERARHTESSTLRVSAAALAAFNQAPALERMARIARTLGDPVINVRDEGPGIPRRVRLTLSWEIAWYEFMVKLDFGRGRASVHETGSGGDPTKLGTELRRANAVWSPSGLKLS